MSDAATLVFESARQLTLEDRFELISKLEELDPPPEGFEYEVSPEFAAELDRRCAEIEADPSKAVKWSDVKARLLASLPND